uniref:Lipoprotein n=1 Tax=uncultured bacterium contig00036 TaxID=1181524 RepID=A0A806KEL9_9BACT|nr:hypothetical protein YdjY [uncultured bacterium contig00036]
MKKIIVCGFVLVLAAAVIFGGCSRKPKYTVPEYQLAAGEETTSAPGIIINKGKREVFMFAVVNGKYFTQPTRHGVVFADGSNGDKSVLIGLGDEKVFYAAMVAVGFGPSNKLTIDDMSKGVSVEGEPLDVFVAWDGKEVPFANVIRASQERPMDIRFGGNLENAKEYNTGCILCLDSCAVGITSNAAYETGASETINFYGKKDVLPADGTMVRVIFRARAFS